MTERSQVCFVSDTIHSYFGSEIETGTGGAERQQYMLANKLLNQDYDVSIATLKYTSTRRDLVDGMDIWRIIPDVRGPSLAPYKAAQTMRGLWSIDADIYYVRGNDFLCMVTAAYTRLTNRGFVYAVANDSNVDPGHLRRHGLLRFPYVRAMQSADRVVAQTDHQKDLLKKEHEISAIQIPNGYEIPPDNELVPHSDREYVLWVGSMDPDQKKPKRYLELALQLPETNFLMIGPPDNDAPEYYDEIKAEAETIPNLEFLGFVDPDEIHDYYHRAIALVSTSDYEGFPNVFLEAWRYATPVVSLYHSLDGILKEEPVGVHTGSMGALVDAVDRIVSDESLRQELGTGGREYMIANYSFEQLIEKYNRIFEEVYRETNL